MKQDLAELHAAAEKAVEIARKGFSDAMEAGSVDAEGEAAAFDALKKAQAHRATCGDLLAARINNRESGLLELQRASAGATSTVAQAQDAVSDAHIHLARVEYDQAAQVLVDAYIKLLSLRTVDSTGRAFKGSTIHEPDLTFASAERAVLGAQLIGESGRVRSYVLADMAKTLAPADLVLLTARHQERSPERQAAAPNPHEFIPGSVQFENAQLEVQRAQMGRDAFEASLRKEQSHPLRLSA
jgi:hypothetical protein